MKRATRVLLALSVCLSAQSAAFADVDLEEYRWTDKLARGATNIVTSPLEIPRMVSIESNYEGPAYGWTAGLAKGVGRTVARAGAGAVDLVTFPFDFPKEDKEPLIQPPYPWQEWPTS